jgi:hypothetical protein
MRKLLTASCAFAVALSSSAAQAQTSVSTNISSAQGNSVNAIGIPQQSTARMAMPSLTSQFNGTTLSGQTIIATQINPGTKPGQMGVAVSVSGGYTTTTTYSGSFGTITGAHTVVKSEAVGRAANGGSFAVSSGVTTSPTETTTTGSGGPGTTITRTSGFSR